MRAPKIFLLLVTMASSIIPCAAFAGDSTTNEWGVMSCGVEMSLKLKDTQEEIKSNQCVNLSVQIKNVSDGRVLIIEPMLKPRIYFDITSPSNKDLSTKEPGARKGLASSNSGFYLEPHNSVEFKFDLSSLCI